MATVQEGGCKGRGGRPSVRLQTDDEMDAAVESALARLGDAGFAEPDSGPAVPTEVPITPKTKRRMQRRSSRVSLQDKLGIPRTFGEEMETKMQKEYSALKDCENRIGSGMKFFLNAQGDAAHPGRGRRPSFSGTINVDARAHLEADEIDAFVKIAEERFAEAQKARAEERRVAYEAEKAKAKQAEEKRLKEEKRNEEAASIASQGDGKTEDAGDSTGDGTADGAAAEVGESPTSVISSFATGAPGASEDGTAADSAAVVADSAAVDGTTGATVNGAVVQEVVDEAELAFLAVEAEEVKRRARVPRKKWWKRNETISPGNRKYMSIGGGMLSSTTPPPSGPSEFNTAPSPRPSRARRKSFSGVPMKHKHAEVRSGLHYFDSTNDHEQLCDMNMLDDLREFFDPSYRLAKLRKNMQETFKKRWGKYHGSEADYWQRRVEVVELFSAIDLDGDGMLGKDELARAFHEYNVHARMLDVDHLVELIDSSGDGFVNIEEFTEWYKSNMDDWLLNRRRDSSPYSLDAKGDSTDRASDRRLLMRASLTFDPSVRAAIDEFWDIVNWEDHLEQKIRHDGKDSVISKYNMQVTKAEYIEFNMNLQRHVAMNGGDLGKGGGGGGGGSRQKGRRGKEAPPVFDEAVAARVAEREWEFDCQGRNSLTYDEFFMSIFQLIDAWADGLDKETYAGFMNTLMQETTTVQHLAGSDGGHTLRGWKWVSDHRLEDEKQVQARVEAEAAEEAMAAELEAQREEQGGGEEDGEEGKVAELGVGFDKKGERGKGSKSPEYVSNRKMSAMMKGNAAGNGAKPSPVRKELAAKAEVEEKIKKKQAEVKSAANLVGKQVEIVGSERADLNGRRGVAKDSDKDGNVKVEVEPKPPSDESLVEVVSADNLQEITPAQQRREAAMAKKAAKLVGKRVEIQGVAPPDESLNGKRGRAEAIEGVSRGEVKIKVMIDSEEGVEPVVAHVSAEKLTEVTPEQESREEAEAKAEAERLASLDPELRAKAEAWYGKMPGQETVEPAEPTEPPADDLEAEIGWAGTDAMQPLSPPNPHAQLMPNGSLPELVPSRGSSERNSFVSDDGPDKPWPDEQGYTSVRKQQDEFKKGQYLGRGGQNSAPTDSNNGADSKPPISLPRPTTGSSTMKRHLPKSISPTPNGSSSITSGSFVGLNRSRRMSKSLNDKPRMLVPNSNYSGDKTFLHINAGSDPTDETTEPSPRQGLLDPLDNHLEGAYDGAASLASWGDGGLRRPSTTSFNDMRRSRQAFDFDTASDMRPFSDDVSTGIEQLNVHLGLGLAEDSMSTFSAMNGATGVTPPSLQNRKSTPEARLGAVNAVYEALRAMPQTESLGGGGGGGGGDCEEGGGSVLTRFVHQSQLKLLKVALKHTATLVVMQASALKVAACGDSRLPSGAAAGVIDMRLSDGGDDGRGSGERKSDEIGLPRLGSPDGPAQPIHACDIEESIRREASTMRAPVGLQVAVSRLVFVDTCGEASDALEAQLLDTVQTQIENLEKGIGRLDVVSDSTEPILRSADALAKLLSNAQTVSGSVGEPLKRSDDLLRPQTSSVALRSSKLQGAEQQDLLSKTTHSQSSSTIGSRALRNQTRSLVGSKELFSEQQSSKQRQIRASADQLRAAKNSRRRTFDVINDDKRSGFNGASLREKSPTRGPQAPKLQVPSMTSVSPFAPSQRPMTTGGGGRPSGTNTSPSNGAGIGAGIRSVLRPNKSGNRHLPPAMRLDRSLLR